MKAICFFDVDDTLVPFGLNDIREQEKKILNQLLENGHYIFVNTDGKFYVRDTASSSYVLQSKFGVYRI